MTENDVEAGPSHVAFAELQIQKLYVKDVSFEAPQSPQAFLQEIKPSVEVHLDSRTTRLGDNVHEVVLAVTVTVKSEDNVIYLVEVQQAGVFTLQGVPADQLGPVLATACPTILFPYAREVVSDLVTRGGFPPLLLAPVNFDALYARDLERRQSEAETKQVTH